MTRETKPDLCTAIGQAWRGKRQGEMWSARQSIMRLEFRFNKNFLDSKITADCDCSHEIKRHLLLGRKVMANLDTIFKSRDVTLPRKVRLVKDGFSSGHVWM